MQGLDGDARTLRGWTSQGSQHPPLYKLFQHPGAGSARRTQPGRAEPDSRGSNPAPPGALWLPWDSPSAGAPSPAPPARHPVQRVPLQPAVPAVQPHHHLVPLGLAPPGHHAPPRRALPAGRRGRPSPRLRASAALRHAARPEPSLSAGPRPRPIKAERAVSFRPLPLAPPASTWLRAGLASGARMRAGGRVRAPQQPGAQRPLATQLVNARLVLAPASTCAAAPR